MITANVLTSVNKLLVKQYLYGKSGPNHISDKLGRYNTNATLPIQTLLGRYNSADTTRPIMMTSSPASFPTHTNMADMF